MSALEPQALDPFSESLSSFEEVNNVGHFELDAAVQSASEPIDMNKIVQNPKVSNETQIKEVKDEDSNTFYTLLEENKLIIIGIIIAIAYYLNRRNNK